MKAPQGGMGVLGVTGALGGGGSRVVDDVEFLPFLEGQVVLRPGLVVIQGDEKRHPPACGTGMRPR